MKARRALFALFLVLGVILMTAGVLRGEMARIHQNGALVCLECIGIN